MNNRLIAFVMVPILVSAGCGGGEGEERNAVDTADPIQVAEAFYEAIAEGNLEAAVEHVLPEQVADFRESMSGSMPGMPPDYKVSVSVEGEQGTAYIEGTSLEVDMILVDGRWWMSR